MNLFFRIGLPLMVLASSAACSRRPPEPPAPTPAESSTSAAPSMAAEESTEKSHRRHASRTTSEPRTETAAESSPSSGPPPPAEGPSEEVLRKLTFQQYDAIEKMGGMRMQSTATGKGVVLRPKLYEVRKNSCKPSPQSPPGWHECSLTIKLSLDADGRNPSEQGARIGVKWDPSGEWVRR